MPKVQMMTWQVVRNEDAAKSLCDDAHLEPLPGLQPAGHGPGGGLGPNPKDQQGWGVWAKVEDGEREMKNRMEWDGL